MGADTPRREEPADGGRTAAYDPDEDQDTGPSATGETVEQDSERDQAEG